MGKIIIRAYPHYLEDQSSPDEAEYCFAYTIEIENGLSQSIQLLERHWLITDANGQQQEVQGSGVVGEQPQIDAGERYAYRSGVQLRTPLGFMQGSYTFQDTGGNLFEEPIPMFTLAMPHLLH